MVKPRVKEEIKPNVMQTWNAFARALIETKKAWNTHVETWAEISTRDVEMLPLEFQRFLGASFNRSKFEVLLPRLIDYYRGYGGIETLYIKLKKGGVK